MIQWSKGPMDHTLTQCSVAISRLDGIGMDKLSVLVMDFFLSSGLLVVFGRFWCVTKIVFRDMSNLPSNDLFSVTVARK